MNLHPTLKRFRARVACVSEAKTARGILNAIKNQGHSFAPRPPRSERAEEYLLREAERTSDPEAKRARHDVKFRKRYLASLKRREKRAREYDRTSLDGVIQFYDTWSERSLELEEIQRLRVLVLGEKSGNLAILARNDPSIVVEDFDADLARKHGAKINMSGKDATLLATRSPSSYTHSPGVTHWKNGKPKGYTRAKNTNCVRSVGLVVDANTFDFCFHATRKRCTLPAGYSWNVDGNGLRIVASGSPDDYHPSVADLLAKTFPGNCIDALRYNSERRRQLKAQEVAARAKVQGVYVCLADSVRAGNCQAGSKSFAARHGLDIRRHYEATQLLDMANGEAQFVRLAITAAVLRHKREIAQGFSSLADHVVK